MEIIFNQKQSFSELIHVLWPEFIEVSGCILIKNNSDRDYNLNMDHILNTFGDRTGFEAFDNHVHMMDVSKEFEKNPIEGLRFALKLLEVWAANLKIDFPDYPFNLIVTFDGQDSILRFHKIREGETWLDTDNLDSYGDTAILVRKVSS